MQRIAQRTNGHSVGGCNDFRSGLHRSLPLAPLPKYRKTSRPWAARAPPSWQLSRPPLRGVGAHELHSEYHCTTTQRRSIVLGAPINRRLSRRTRVRIGTRSTGDLCTCMPHALQHRRCTLRRPSQRRQWQRMLRNRRTQVRSQLCYRFGGTVRVSLPIVGRVLRHRKRVADQIV